MRSCLPIRQRSYIHQHLQPLSSSMVTIGRALSASKTSNMASASCVSDAAMSSMVIVGWRYIWRTMHVQCQETVYVPPKSAQQSAQTAEEWAKSSPSGITLTPNMLPSPERLIALWETALTNFEADQANKGLLPPQGKTPRANGEPQSPTRLGKALFGPIDPDRRVYAGQTACKTTSCYPAPIWMRMTGPLRTQPR